MKPWLRSLALLAVCSFSLAGGANAQPPVTALCIVPRCVPLVGKTAAGGVDPAGQFTITVNNGGGPIPGCNVVIDFSACVDICIGNQASNNFVAPGGIPIVIGPGKTASAMTNAVGVATFRIVGGATNPMGCAAPASGAGCAAVYACGVPPVGVLIRNVTVNAYNEDGSLGASGVAANDLSAWLGDFFCGIYGARSDFDCSGALGGNDLAAWLALYFAGGSVTGALGNVAPCP